MACGHGLKRAFSALDRWHHRLFLTLMSLRPIFGLGLFQTRMAGLLLRAPRSWFSLGSHGQSEQCRLALHYRRDPG